MKSRFLIPAILITLTFAFLVSLGFWQLDRAEEKRSIEASIKSANAGVVELIESTGNLEDKEYHCVVIQYNHLLLLVFHNEKP